MVKFQKTITIHAPVEKVFTFLGDPRNLLEIWPNLLEVTDLTPAPVGGFNFGWVFKMAGMRFEGASEVVEYVQSQRLVTRSTHAKSTKGIENKFTWDFETVDSDTKLMVEVEYVVPTPVLGKLAEAIAVKQNEHEMQALLDNLKTRMELETPVAV